MLLRTNMWKISCLFLLLLQQVCGGTPGEPGKTQATSPGFLGKLLVVPMDGSHWVGIIAVAQELGRRGHQVTVLMPEVSLRMHPGDHYKSLTFPVPYNSSFLDSVMATLKTTLQKSSQSLFEKVSVRLEQVQKFGNFLHTTAESLLYNSSLISHLASQEFDAVLTDPIVPTGPLIARKLGLPTVNLVRAIPCALDAKSSGCPSPPSYVPRFATGYTDRMDFKERVINTLVAAVEPLLCRLFFWHFDHIAAQFLGEKVGIAEVLTESDIWLLRLDFTLEFPRPLMPNVIPVGGIHCNVRNPLPQELQSWLSGEHGFIVFTLGSMVSEMPEDMTSVFLEAFRRIPQKVIWRFTGTDLDNVPENVKIMKWVPQNDLLAHPGARAFLTHAGSHGLFEGICHGVPMVMLPLNADQPDNAQRLVSRGAGVVLDIFSLTPEGLVHGINQVINDPSYKANIQRLSALHKDRPVDPLDLSAYWTEFVMRHKGARHLKSAQHDLNWIQYHSLDVLVLLTVVVLILATVTVKLLKLCLRKVTGKKKQE